MNKFILTPNSCNLINLLNISNIEIVDVSTQSMTEYILTFFDVNGNSTCGVSYNNITDAKTMLIKIMSFIQDNTVIFKM